MAASSIGGASAFSLSNVYTDFITTRYGSTGGASGITLSKFSSNFSKIKHDRLETSCGLLRGRMGQTPIWVGGLLALQRFMNPFTVNCGPSSKTMKDSEECPEKKSTSSTSHIIPNSLEVESLLTQICDTSIAEFELKLGGFRLYVMRDLVGKKEPPLPPSPPTITTNAVAETHDSNGSVTTTSLALSKSKPSVGGIQRLLETASDEGLVILQSPKVGYFRRSRTIKGKRAPPSCKEKQTVKEGQVLCYIEQLGGEIPVESDVSGEVIKILREDGEPVGYGDDLIAILPSFPGIKKLQ